MGISLEEDKVFVVDDVTMEEAEKRQDIRVCGKW